MDWFEQLFGFAPDNGSGTLEVLVMLVIAAIALVAFSRSRRPLPGTRYTT